MDHAPKKKFLAWLTPDLLVLALALAFGGYSAESFFRAPPPPLSKPEKNSRGPASITTETALVTSQKTATPPERSTRIWNIGCIEEKTATLATKAGLLRIVADECGPKIDGLRAENKATREKLLLFNSTGRVSTHYFPLKAGTNEIVVEWQGRGGPHGSLHSGPHGGKKILRVEREI